MAVDTTPVHPGRLISRGFRGLYIGLFAGVALLLVLVLTMFWLGAAFGVSTNVLGLNESLRPDGTPVVVFHTATILIFVVVASFIGALIGVCTVIYGKPRAAPVPE